MGESGEWARDELYDLIKQRPVGSYIQLHTVPAIGYRKLGSNEWVARQGNHERVSNQELADRWVGETCGISVLDPGCKYRVIEREDIDLNNSKKLNSGKTVFEFIKTLDGDQIVEVYDTSHNVAYHGKANDPKARITLKRYADKGLLDDYINHTEDEAGTIIINASKLNSALTRNDIPAAQQNIYDDVANYVSGVIEEGLQQLMETKLTAQVVKDNIKTYDPEWAEEDYSREMEDAVNAAINATVNAELQGLFGNLVRNLSSSRNSLNSAESDFIRIGNKVIPKDASGYGYADYSTIQRDAKRKREQEIADELAEADRQARAKKGEALRQQYDAAMEAVEGSPLDDRMSTAFEVLVPASGAADTQAGELIRAIERLRYRYYNDGDYFYKGYGLETAGSSAAWLFDQDSKLESYIDTLADKELKDSDYEDTLDLMAEYILKYLNEHPEYFGDAPTSDSRDYDSVLVDEWKDASHNLEFDVDTSGEYLDTAIDRGWITWEDVEYCLEDWARDMGGNVRRWAHDGFTITDLDDDEYDEWEHHFYKWWEEWLTDVMNEHEDELYEDEEDEWEEDED